MSRHRLPITVLLLLAGCRGGEASPGPTDLAPDVSNARYVLRAVDGDLLPQPATTDAVFPAYIADTIRFDVAVAAKIPGPLGLSGAVFRDASGEDVTSVLIFRYVQDGQRLSFPPVCVPTEGCPERFASGKLDGRWMTLEAASPFRGPLLYERM